MTPPALNRRTPRYLLPSRTKDIIIHHMVNPETIVQFLKRRQISLLIGACALAMVALIAFQVNWMKHSSRLIEEQFNNRVNMALCSAVESLAADQNSSASFRACCAEVNTQPGCMQSVDELPTATGMNQTLAQSLNFYQISLPYEAVIAPKDTLNIEQGEIPPFSCALTPILQDDTHMLQLQFKGKAGYILDKMGWMVGASIVILLFISGIFTLASYYLLRQKKMSDLNRDFFNHMTHEFRTPLTNIRLASGLLSKKDQELRSNPYLEIIRKESDHLMKQVESVLHLATLEKGDYLLKKSPVDLQKLIGEVVGSMELQIREKEAQVHLDGSQTPCSVTGDAFHLSNVFRNLLDNALKYNPGKTAIHIGFRPSAEGCTVLFEDNGVGLNEKEQEMIFNKYYRGSGDQKGFGLGLAYAKKIVEMHMGRIQLSSTRGAGAHFELFFPN